MDGNPSEPTLRPKPVGRGVIGVLVRDGRYLMIQRAAGLRKGGHWCFPGGHVERGETPRQAVVREMQEELGVCVAPSRRLGSLRVWSGEYVLVVWAVVCDDGAFKPEPAEIADWRWVSLDGIATLAPGLPSNQEVVDLIERAKRRPA